MLKKCQYLFLVLCFFVISCQQEKQGEKSKYARYVSDIAHDPKIDKSDFKLCNGDNKVVQYYALGEKPFANEKLGVKKNFLKKYKVIKSDQTGNIRIRFVVNCHGETDRFRMVSFDNDYKPMTFDDKITDQLMSITKSIDSWKTEYASGRELDFYYYFLFKIENGQLIEVLP